MMLARLPFRLGYLLQHRQPSGIPPKAHHFLQRSDLMRGKPQSHQQWIGQYWCQKAGQTHPWGDCQCRKLFSFFGHPFHQVKCCKIHRQRWQSTCTKRLKHHLDRRGFAGSARPFQYLNYRSKRRHYDSYSSVPLVHCCYCFVRRIAGSLLHGWGKRMAVEYSGNGEKSGIIEETR